MTCIDSLFNEFNDSDLTGVVNRGAFLSNFIKQWKIRNPQQLKITSDESQSAQGSTSSSNANKPILIFSPDKLLRHFQQSCIHNTTLA